MKNFNGNVPNRTRARLHHDELWNSIYVVFNSFSCRIVFRQKPIGLERRSTSRLSSPIDHLLKLFQGEAELLFDYHSGYYFSIASPDLPEINTSWQMVYPDRTEPWGNYLLMGFLTIQVIQL